MRHSSWLARCRSPWCGSIQLFAALLIALWPQTGLPEWVDSDNDQVLDAWSMGGSTHSLSTLDQWGWDLDGDNAYNSEELTYGSDPFSYDTDSDGLDDGTEIHIAIQTAGKAYSLTEWDSDGDDVSDHDDFYGVFTVTYPGGQLPSFPGASYFDYDGDGIKNPFDPYPADPLNNDYDGDGIDDAVDPVLDDPTNSSPHNDVEWGSAAMADDDHDLIANFWDELPYDKSNGVLDVDGDGILTYQDPFPTDPTNHSPVNGVAWYERVLADADADGIVNHADVWPFNPANTQGGANDADSDGIVDSLDPLPADPHNHSTINGRDWYTLALSDADNDGQTNFDDPEPEMPYNGFDDFDGDGWSNGMDPFPRDATNYSALNDTAWGAYLHDDSDWDGYANWQDSHPNDPDLPLADPDGDGIPNSLDPSPFDWSNVGANGVGWASGATGDDDGDGIWNIWDYSPFGEGGTDEDSDGIPDGADPYPSDYSNNSNENGMAWHGSALGDSDHDGIRNWCDPSPNDSYADGNLDGDSFLNGVDPVPLSPDNYSPHNSTTWYTSALDDSDGDGIANFYDYRPYETENVDLDGDGFIFGVDPFPNDPSNYSHFNYTQWSYDIFGDADGDGVFNYLDRTPWLPDLDNDGLNGTEEYYWGTSEGNVDTDEDGLTDAEEVYIFGTGPTNKFSVSQENGWGDLYTDWQLVDLTDTDGDGIPNRVEAHYNLNPQWAGDALLDLDNNGISNLAQYQMGVSLGADLDNYDADEDGMSDVVEDYYEFLKQNPADAIEDADSDGVLNYEEIALLLSPVDSDTNSLGGLGDLITLMESVRYPEGGAPTTDDAPSNGIPDWIDLVLATPSAPDYFHFTRSSPGDLDGDALPDAWEHRYGRWRYHTGVQGLQIRVNDAEEDNDGDGLNNLLEYQIGTVPIAGDSDGDGVLDGNEDTDGDGLTNAQEILLGTLAGTWDTDGDGISDGQEVEDGTDPLDSNSNSDLFIGLRFTSPVE